MQDFAAEAVQLGRASAELAELALLDGRKADRRPAVGPRVDDTPPAPAPWLPAVPMVAPVGDDTRPAELARPEVPAALPELGFVLPDTLPLVFDAPAAWVGPRPLDDRLEDAALASDGVREASPATPGGGLEQDGVARAPERARHRAESWSIPLVPVPRKGPGAGRA